MIQFYHPNKSVKGFAASFWRGADNSFFGTIIRQFGWDARTGNGIFKNSMKDINMKVNAKLSIMEIGGILDCIERNRSFEAFHDSEDRPKSIKFLPVFSKEDKPVQKGFSFSITVKDKQDSTYANSFFILLTLAEARALREFLIFTLHELFAAKTDELALKRQSRGSTVEEQVSAAPVEEVAESIDGISGL